LVILRDATAADWQHIFPFFAETVAAGETYAYPEDLSSEQARALWMQPPPWRTIVAVEDEQVLGSAIVGPNRPGRGSHVATASFMVAPAAQGRGIGRALGEHVLELAGAAGYRAMQFNAVVETNRAAVALWCSLGFTILATVPEAFDHPSHGFVGLHIMYRSLLPEGPDLHVEVDRRPEQPVAASQSRTRLLDSRSSSGEKEPRPNSAMFG
jgi:L-amino acid N-acyltransferase YncA